MVIAAAQVFAATLAAGRATRFGGDKLGAGLGGGTVLDASLAALAPFAWRGQAVVLDSTRASGPSPIAVIENPEPRRGMGHSLALAAREAQRCGAAALLVTLGDMPLVSATSVAELLAVCPPGATALAAMVAPDRPPGPPAIFGRHWFARLAACDGEEGARELLRDERYDRVLVPLPAHEAADIDTPADLEAIRAGGR